MDTSKVDRAIQPWQHQRHVVAQQWAPGASRPIHAALKGERATRRQHRQIHAARSRRVRVVVAGVLTHPQLEGH